MNSSLMSKPGSITSQTLIWNFFIFSPSRYARSGDSSSESEDRDRVLLRGHSWRTLGSAPPIRRPPRKSTSASSHRSSSSASSVSGSGRSSESGSTSPDSLPVRALPLMLWMADSCKLREIHFKATNFIKKGCTRPYFWASSQTTWGEAREEYVIFKVHWRKKLKSKKKLPEPVWP